jgi:hypothetical protein
MRSAGVGAKGVGAGLVSLVVVAACSSSSSRPPLLADCEANDAGCSTQTGAGGGGTGGDSGSASSCDQMDFSGSSQCTQCAALECCPAFTACLIEDTTCENLYNCEAACGGVATCIDTTCAPFTSAAATFNELETCLRGKCAVCAESGIGDPCGAGAPSCAPALTCFDGWCTQDCTASTMCTGLGPNGTNVLGFANACLTIAGTGDVCVPGCASNSDCDVDFADTFCFGTTDVGGTAVQVCSRLADAGH